MSNYSYLDTTTADLDYPLYFPSTSIDFVNSKSIPPEYTFTRNSAGTYVGPDGLIKTANANQPRFDYDPITKEFKGLLIEESRTNGILYNDLSAWITEPTKTFETGLSGIFSQSYSFTTTYSGGESGRIYSSSGFGNVSTNQIVSVFVKQKTNLGGNPSICFRNSTSGSAAYFNLDTLSFGVTSSTEWSGPGYQNFGNGWYRFYAIFVGPNTSTMRLYMGGTNGSVNNATVGTSFYLNGFQAETGFFPTSYIPTSGSTVTRLADQLILNQSLSTSGTFFVEARPTTGTTLVADNGTNAYYISPTLNTTTKNALYYNTNRVLTMSSSSTPSQFINFQSTSGLNRVSLGFDRINNTSYINGHIKNFKYYDSPVTEDNLRSLTGSNKNISRSDGTIVTSGLVLNLDAGNRSSYSGSGTTWTDLSGQGNNGTLVNGPTYSSTNGGSIVFDGVNDYVSFVNATSLITTQMTMDVTIAVPNPLFSQAGYYFAGIMGLYGDNNYYRESFIQIGNDGNIANSSTFSASVGYLALDSSSTGIVFGTFPFSTIPINLVYVRSGSNGFTYVNGNFVSSSSSIPSNTRPVDTNLEIGWVNNAANYGNYRGNIFNAKIYNRALTATEVQQNFNALRGRFGI